MEKDIIQKDTIQLLEEINLGCLMAANSFQQIQEYEMREELAQMLQKYKEKHEEIQKEAAHMLYQYGSEEKKPHPVTEAMSWITTEIKMLRKDGDTQIAKLMMDGCNMGIQSIGEKVNDFSEADKEAVSLGKKLIKLEQEFMDEMKAFL